MKQALYTAIAMIVAFLAFAGVASAQVYYPQYSQLTWRPPVYYQNFNGGANGYFGGYGSFTQPAVINQPRGICITCGGYGAWGGINSGTGFGTWGGNYMYLTRYR